MRAAAIFFFARVIRAAIVGSLTRKARATSAVVRPHSSRSVSATCASGAMAGWQQVKISRSLSSVTSYAAHVARSLVDLLVEQQRQRAAQRGVTAQQVHAAAPGDRREPGAGIGGHAARSPRRQRPRVRVLHALLGEVEVARDAHRRGEHEGPLATVRVGDRSGNGRVRGHARLRQSNTRTGRTSTPPNRAGTCLATAMASSRSAASIR